MSVRSLIARALWPAVRWALRHVRIDDPWERLDVAVPLTNYGPGARYDFAWYFEGDSRVRVRDPGDVAAWLRDCAYVRDADLFREVDYWQHPQTFEQLRRGDCEDHALWAWRKLVELGYDADLVTGCCLPDRPDDGARGRHAWVVFRMEGETFLFETVAERRPDMIRRLAEVRDRYRPEYGVDRERRRFAYGGALLSLRERGTRREPGPGRVSARRRTA